MEGRNGGPEKQSEDSWTLDSGSSVTMAEFKSKIILHKSELKVKEKRQMRF